MGGLSGTVVMVGVVWAFGCVGGRVGGAGAVDVCGDSVGIDV